MWNGTGTYVLNPSYSPEVNGTTINATRYNGLMTDIANAISNCIAKDGQNIATGNLGMNGFKHTGAGVATATGQYLTWGQSASFAVGAAATPSITFGSYSTTGMWSPSADVLALSTAGVERVRLDSSGNLGIGGFASAGAVVQIRKDGGAASTVNSLVLQNMNGTTAGNTTRIGFGAYRDTDLNNMGAAIQATSVNGSINGNLAHGGYLSLMTAVDGALGLVERMRIAATGEVTATGHMIANGNISANGAVTGATFNGFLANGNISQFTNDSGYVLPSAITSGTYTPTVTVFTGSSTINFAYSMQWSRVNNTVTFSGFVSLNITATGPIEVHLTTPVASNFVGNTDAGGAVGSIVGSGYVAAVASNDHLALLFNANVTGSGVVVGYSGTYLVR